MISIRRVFTGFAGSIGGLALLFAPTTAADATTAHRAAPEHPACATGFRGQPAYDRHCLRRGTVHDARREWKSAPRSERRAHCDMAVAIGFTTMVIETRGDVIGDTYRNNRQVIRWTVGAARLECSKLRETRTN